MNGKESDNDFIGNSLFIVTMVVCILSVTMWILFREPIVSVTLQASSATAELLKTLKASNGITSWIAFVIAPHFDYQDLDNIIKEAGLIDARDSSFGEASKFFDMALAFPRLLVLPLAIFTAFYILKVQAPTRAKKIYTQVTLMEEVAQYYPHLKPAIQANKKFSHLKETILSPAQHPIRHAINNKIITVHDIDYQGNIKDNLLKPTFDYSYKDKSDYIHLGNNIVTGISKIHKRCVFVDSEAEKAFVAQLGRKYSGVDDLPIHSQMLYGIFASFLQGTPNQKQDAFKAMAHLNNTFDGGKIHTQKFVDPRPALELMDKYRHTEIVKEVEEKYAYENTLLPGLLMHARQKGKLWSAFWYWLKWVDRPLWYVLHQEGGQTAWIEAAGPRAHKLAEEANGVRVEKPFVETAVIAYREFLDETEGWLVPNEEDETNLCDEDD